mmetsp:Transcript_31214/g.74197  ORF Transcript_31214/g.74197 Transcript_31214/m.74197 type:complete len:207 (+) Transcript_31214:483-1103(+)
MVASLALQYRDGEGCSVLVVNQVDDTPSPAVDLAHPQEVRVRPPVGVVEAHVADDAAAGLEDRPLRQHEAVEAVRLPELDGRRVVVDAAVLGDVLHASAPREHEAAVARPPVERRFHLCDIVGAARRRRAEEDVVEPLPAPWLRGRLQPEAEKPWVVFFCVCETNNRARRVFLEPELPGVAAKNTRPDNKKIVSPCGHCTNTPARN